MATGWIKLHRKLTEWEWYSDVNTSRVFLHLLLVVNHKDNKWRGIDIKRGQKLSSISGLAKETNLSIKNIRTAIKRLKSTNEVASYSTAQHTIFTVVNYDSYQNEASEKASSGQTRGKLGATNNNDNNDNKKIICPYQQIADLWNEMFSSQLQSVSKVTDKRKTAIRSCIKEMNGLLDLNDIDNWRGLFSHASKSDFLMGRNKDGWTMSFDFFITKSKMIKIYEGDYDNNTTV